MRYAIVGAAVSALLGGAAAAQTPQGSSFTYQATATGNFTIRAGCYSSGSCSGTVVYTVQ